MLHVSLFIELLRSRPRSLVLAAALTQAALWWLVPVLFYTAPPGDLALTIAVGHEFNLGSYWGPPLAAWAAEIAFDVAGMAGVYLLAQACVVVTYLAVFELGKAIVGAQHAAIAVMLMVGIAALSVPTPTFGPPILAMPLAAYALLYFWRAVGEGQRRAWYVSAALIGLLILTTHAGFILLAALAVFTLANHRGRKTLLTFEPWVAAVLLVVIIFPHLLWLDISGMGTAWMARLSAGHGGARLVLLGRDLLLLVLSHAGMLLLVVLALGWPAGRPEPVPVFQRHPLTPFERRFVLSLALSLPLAATLIGAMLGERSPVGGTSPNVLLSGLAVVVLAGTVIAVHRQWLIGFAWSLLLVAPPLIAALSVAVMPFVSAEPTATAQPARAIGRYFGETFERRTGHKLAIVTGDPRLATLVALGARSRPSFFYDAAPRRTPWVTIEDIRTKGAIVVWPATDMAGAPPPEIKARFPGLVPELPHAFNYAIQGRLPLLRVGWGMLRPQ
jgi:4-amino-4-deoxy-L-arabinose transferase-like glycosyltransferase